MDRDSSRHAAWGFSSQLVDFGLSVKQPVYNAGKVHNAVHLAEESRQEKLASLEAVRQRVAFKVFQSFNDLLLAEENETLIRETYQQRQKHLELARSRFTNGTTVTLTCN